MSKTEEGKLRDKVSNYLKTLKGVWFYKSSDRFTSGIPDFLICKGGKFFGLELKAPGKDGRRLQLDTLSLIHKAKGYTLCTDSFEEVKDFIEKGTGKEYTREEIAKSQRESSYVNVETGKKFKIKWGKRR